LQSSLKTNEQCHGLKQELLQLLEGKSNLRNVLFCFHFNTSYLNKDSSVCQLWVCSIVKDPTQILRRIWIWILLPMWRICWRIIYKYLCKHFLSTFSILRMCLDERLEKQNHETCVWTREILSAQTNVWWVTTIQFI